MTTVLRLSAVALCLLAAACSKKEEKDKPAAPVADTPLIFEQKTADAEVNLTFPEAMKTFPYVHAQAYTAGKENLEIFIAQSARDRAALIAEGSNPPPYLRTIKWTVSGQSDRLFSAYSELTNYTDGAHSNMIYHAELWDKKTTNPVGHQHLFVNGSGTDLSSADTFLCHQIEAERSHRNENPTTQAEGGFTCPKLFDSHFVLLPSTVKGKIGGLLVLFAPYDVGPYAEGPYQIRIPQAVIRAVINPAYAADFAGDPVAVTTDPAG
ncbi:RsiV family protein [Asticcacaulis sp. YBE204]|uniref:RsiV family protein n=1 Tax=Asticcacaulis sp. YBE204 TaxID=1282363 RepID=UPI0003C3F771|nr:RsiV family protein [Asticcacaulis sp. YBE204]ESQ80599.1 hypothetical protein AEYBE204_04835 [Asticcacaulis sp. YBE204]